MSLPKGYKDEQGRLMGLHLNLPEAEYHAVKAFSYSGSKEFARSPEHFKAYLNKEWEVDPDREKFKAVHLLCLEPELHDRLVVVDGVWRGKVKEQVQELQKQGKIVLKPDAKEEAETIASRMKAHSVAGPVLSKSICEVSIFWIEDGVYCKCRIDILAIVPGYGICLIDLKNFGDLSSEGLIGYQIGEKKYFMQMAWYSRAIEVVFGEAPKKVSWFFVEAKPPHGIKIRTCGHALLEPGWIAISSMLPSYKECLENDVWPGYAEDEQDAGMPDKYFQVIGE